MKKRWDKITCKKLAVRTLAGLLLLALLAASLPAPAPLAAQTPPPTPPPNTSSDPTTADYLSEPMRLLFPSLPASIDLNDVSSRPIAPGDDKIWFDVVGLGTLASLENTTTTQPVSKTLTLRLRGGIRGRVFAEPPWLAPQPDRFINPKDTGELKIDLTVRRDATQGAGLLPGQTNWGRLRVVLNGTVFDYAAPLIVGTPRGLPADSSDKIFALHRQIVARLDSNGDLAAAISTPLYPNAAGFALGLTVDYLGEKNYNTKLSEADFVNRVAETLAEKDYNNDGWVGFKPEDILIGAPGWALGRKIR